MLFWKFIWHSTNWKSIYFLSKMHIRDTYKNFAAIHISEDCSKEWMHVKTKDTKDKDFNTKISFFGECTKMQLITSQNFNIQTCFCQFLWFFSFKCWFKGQIISRICLILPNAYKLMCFDRNINRNFWSVIICFCSGTQTHFSNENYYNFLNVIISSGSMWSKHAWLEAITYRRD